MTSELTGVTGHCTVVTLQTWHGPISLLVHYMTAERSNYFLGHVIDELSLNVAYLLKGLPCRALSL